MNIFTSPLITDIFFFFGLIVLVSLGLFVYVLLKKEKTFQDKEAHALNNYQSILQSGQNQAENIVEKAADLSAQMLAATGQTKTDVHNTLDKAVQELLQKDIDSLSLVSAEYLKAYKRNLTVTLQSIQEKSQVLLAAALADLQKETIDNKSSLQQFIDEELAEARTMIEQYKKDQVSKAAAEVNELVVKSYREVMKKSIPASYHQALLQEALEEAKEDGIFL
ncbi:MAG TPA: hypothetical protein VGT05_04360 [Patescibacteria group bacterium]|nr:hypothetical protein [Patescibacteria group bacterium]